MSTRSSRRKPAMDPEPLPPVEEEDDGITEEDGVTSQEETFEEYVGADGGDDEPDDAELEEDEEEGLEENWGEEGELVEEDEEEANEDMLLDEDGGSMSPTDAIDVAKQGEDPICYHCGVPLVEPPMLLPVSDDAAPTVLPSPTAASISIPLHCEVCARGIHAQCHISLGGALPTQEESFVCFHCRTSQHGKYAMKAADRVRVSIGPDHQVPFIPPIFFARPKTERPTLVSKSFVQVWSAEIMKGVYTVDQPEVGKYIHQASQLWPDRLRVNSTAGNLASGSVRRLYIPRANNSNNSGVLTHYWCPFSPDFALTVLHKCNYNTERALRAISDPLFRDCFTDVCHPPTKPYYNKWKPKDRRWRMMKLPFPPSRIEAPMVDNNVYGGYEREYENAGPRLRSRRYNNY